MGVAGKENFILQTRIPGFYPVETCFLLYMHSVWLIIPGLLQWIWDFFLSIFIFLNIFIDYAITVVPFPPFTPLHPAHPLPPTFCPYSSCPWVILISSLASTFPILFLPSPCLFATYHLCYLFSVPFHSLSPSNSPVDNPSCDLHFCGSVPVVVVCLVHFCFCLCFF